MKYMMKSIEVESCQACHDERSYSTQLKERKYDFPKNDPVYEFNSAYFKNEHLPERERINIKQDAKILRAPHLDKLLLMTKTKD